MKNRIDYLDGLRGLAIILVIAYHAYARWPQLVPYGDKYANIFAIKYGWLGVELFFLISGFVILMTLEKCQDAIVFIYKRWLRLFPGMLIASGLVFLSTYILMSRPAGQPSLIDILPGITFSEPEWWSRLLGVDVSSLEGAFWSLYVEFKFYIFSAVIYYLFGKYLLYISLIAVYLLAILSRLGHEYLDINVVSLVYKVSVQFSFHYFGWFAAGAAYFLYHQTQKQHWFFQGLCISILCSLEISQGDVAIIFAALLVSGLFAAALLSRRFQNILASRILLFFGFISYPLYLIHENAMISMTIFLGDSVSGMPSFLYPILPVIVLSLIAWLIAAHGEKWLRRTLDSILRPAVYKLSRQE